MSKVVTFYRPGEPVLKVLHPAPGARLVAVATAAGLAPVTFAPPIPLDRVAEAMHSRGASQFTAGFAETEDEFVARIVAKDVPADAIDVTVIDKAALPADRTFRAAWTREGDAVAIDMPKARQHWLDAVIRPARDAELARLDAVALRAVESEDKAALAAIAAQKQALRDLPATIRADLDAAATPDDLKALRVAVTPDAAVRAI